MLIFRQWNNYTLKIACTIKIINFNRKNRGCAHLSNLLTSFRICFSDQDGCLECSSSCSIVFSNSLVLPLCFLTLIRIKSCVVELTPNALSTNGSPIIASFFQTFESVVKKIDLRIASLIFHFLMILLMNWSNFDTINHLFGKSLCHIQGKCL